MYSLSLVIPVYNSMEIIPELIGRIENVLPKISDEFEVILVNDGSKDNSWERIKTEAEHRNWVKGINLMRNFGQQNAILCGIHYSQNDVIITMDDDLQNPPEEISKLLSEFEKGFDVVYGTPIGENQGIWRKLGSIITKATLQSAMGVKGARDISTYRVIHAKFRDAVSNYSAPFISIDVLLSWTTNLFSSVPVNHDSRLTGKSNYTLSTLVSHAIDLMTSYSVIPLKIASIIGILFTLFGFCILAFVVSRYLIQGGSVPGFSFLASIIAIFSGAQLFSIGIIGQYLARMHYRLMDRPSYLIREMTK